jgi:hypothetical protein
VFCPSASFQIRPQSGSKNFSRVFQAQNLFSEIFFKKGNWLEKFQNANAMLEKINMDFGKFK